MIPCWVRSEGATHGELPVDYQRSCLQGELFAESRSTNRSAFDYLASIFLFDKRLSLFIDLVDSYCTTEESLRVCLKSFRRPSSLTRAILRVGSGTM